MTPLSEPAGRPPGRVVATVILAIIAILCLIAGILYLTEPVGSLPGFLNTASSLKGTTGHHSLRAIVAFVLTAIFLIAAGFSFAYRAGGRAASQR